MSIWAVAGLGCNNVNVNTPTRSLDGPSDVALICIQASPVDFHVYDVHPIGDCSPDRVGTAGQPGPVVFQGTDDNGNPLNYFPIERALVTNETRGELAVVEILEQSIINLNPQLPGYNFLPVGDLPEHVRVSADGCQSVTANVDSCDLGVIDNSILNNMSRMNDIVDSGLPPGSALSQPTYAYNVVKRVAPTIHGVPLNARPSWVEFAPENEPARHSYERDANGQFGLPGQCIGGTYNAWVALPNCQVVVEVSLEASEYNANGVIPAEVERAISVTPNGISLIADPSTISCPAECGGTPASSVAPSPSPSPVLVPTNRSYPSSLAFDFDTGASRLFIGDAYGEKIGVVPLAPDGSVLGQPRTIALEAGALGVDTVRVAPRSPAGKFLYAVARDASVRVVDLDRETECETNPDPRYLQAVSSPDPLPQARYFGCFPLGAEGTPPRSPIVATPGIQLSPGVLPKDVLFVHLDVPQTEANTSPAAAGPATAVGDYAWILGSDGRANMVNIYDACPQPNIPQLLPGTTTDYTPACSLSPAVIVPSRTTTFTYPGNPVPTDNDRVSHRLRGGSSRFYLPPDIEDNVGQPRIQDETAPFTVSVNGLAAGTGTNNDAATALTDSLPQLWQGQVYDPYTNDPNSGFTRHIAFYDPDRVTSQTWSLLWEGALPNTNRAQGVIRNGMLVDLGAQFCAHDVLPGDKLYMVGCTNDDQCDHVFSCYHDQAAPSDVTSGLCLPNNLSSDQANLLYAYCAPLLEAQRRYRILDAKSSWPLPGGGEVSDYLTLGELYEPEHPSLTRTCASDVDCAGTLVDGLTTNCMSDSDGQLRCLRGCAPANAPASEQACGPDYECVQTQQRPDHPYRCVRAPLDPTLLATCFTEQQTYEVHVGESFLVAGASSGVFINTQSNLTTGSCETTPGNSEYVRLRNSRLPYDPPPCPASLTDPLGILDPATGISSCGMTATTTLADMSSTSYVRHYENPFFAIGVVAPTVPPDYTSLQFVVIGGAFTQSILLQIDTPAQIPKTGVVAPDQQTVYVVDVGRQSVGTGLQGQLFRFFSQLSQIDTAFVIR